MGMAHPYHCHAALPHPTHVCHQPAPRITSLLHEQRAKGQRQEIPRNSVVEGRCQVQTRRAARSTRQRKRLKGRIQRHAPPRRFSIPSFNDHSYGPSQPSADRVWSSIRLWSANLPTARFRHPESRISDSRKLYLVFSHDDVCVDEHRRSRTTKTDGLGSG